MRSTVAALLLVCLAPAALAGSGAALTDAEINRQMALDSSCITQAEAQIANQNEIGQASGVVDRHALYVAGMNKVQCRHHMAALVRCAQRAECAGLVWEPPKGVHEVPGKANTYVLDPTDAP